MTGSPRIVVTLPDFEEIISVIVVLRGAGATITENHREFAVQGPLTPAQASAAWQLVGRVTGASKSRRPAVRVEPEMDVRTALDLMCPGGWGEWDSSEPDRGDEEQWWFDQQRLQDELRNQPKATPPAPVVDQSEAAPVCCGKGGSWAPKPGQPLVVGCQLCPNSPTYWRRGRAGATAGR